MLDNYDLSTNKFFANTVIVSGNIAGNILHVNGLYETSNAQITGNAITAITSANIRVGQYITGVGVDSGTVITEFITGTGGIGTYYVNRTQDIANSLLVVSQKDGYLGPADRDKYIVFPQIGVYR